MSSFERDEVTRAIVQEHLARAHTSVQQLEDLELRRALTLDLNRARDRLAGVVPRLRLVVGPFFRKRDLLSSADCLAGAEDLPPDGPEAA